MTNQQVHKNYNFGSLQGFHNGNGCSSSIYHLVIIIAGFFFLLDLPEIIRAWYLLQDGWNWKARRIGPLYLGRVSQGLLQLAHLRPNRVTHLFQQGERRGVVAHFPDLIEN